MIFGMSRFSSLVRFFPWVRWQRITVFHFPPITSRVASTDILYFFFSIMITPVS
ncbi:Uncharacterised protein [Mycobacteroides abscessus subsp. abscessus]|nr:Uncharacterised protein [Mycobacteroides abscessus subsp. abscessus]